MTPWRFFDYVAEDGRNPIQEWYAVQDLGVRAALDFTIHQLRVTDDWINPKIKQFSLFERELVGLGELRFWTKDQTRKRKFRVAGLYRPIRRDFIMFTGCEKSYRGSVYSPKDALELAMKYKLDFDAQRGSAIDHV